MKASLFSRLPLLLVLVTSLIACSKEKKDPPHYTACIATLHTDETKSICWESTAHPFEEVDDADEYCETALGNMVEIEPGTLRTNYAIEATEACSMDQRIECEKSRMDPTYLNQNNFFLYGGISFAWCVTPQ